MEQDIDELFAWNDRFNVGVDVIDSAHQRLFTIVRRLIKNTSAGDYEKNKKTCIEVVKYLKQYTVQHFAEEEAFQKKIGYSGYTNHKRIHDNMREITIPSLEGQMIKSDFSKETVEHFTGVCAAWLTAHVMLEDQAIVGRTKSLWEKDYDGNAIELLKKYAENFMLKIFKLIIEAENMNYDGYDIGESMYYYIIFRGEKNTIYRSCIIINRTLLLETLGKLLGKKLTYLNAISMSMVGELSRNFAENFIKAQCDDDIKVIGSGTVEKEKFAEDFNLHHPDLSMLWNTPYGHIAFNLRTEKIK